MLLGFTLSPEAIGGLQAIALAVVAGYVAIRTRQIDASQRRCRARIRREGRRNTKLESRVRELEDERDARRTRQQRK